MITPARQAAFHAISRIEIQRAHSDDALNSDEISRLAARDRNLVTEIVYGTLRWRAWLDYILETAASRSLETVDPKTRFILRLSLYQMAHMSRIPDHAIIFDAVELAKASSRPQAAGFVNGVLRALSRTRPWVSPDFHRDCPIWVRMSLPKWLWDRWNLRFGTDRASEYALSLNRPPRTAFRLRQGLPKFRTPDIPEAGDPFPTITSPPFACSELVPGAFLVEDGGPDVDPGSVRFQDEASQLIPYLMGDVSGAAIWDACAAPGGKSSIFREICGPMGWVVSSDLILKRAQRMRIMLSGPAGSKSDIVVADARFSAPFLKLFDAVLVDAPCSGLGTLRRNPELKWFGDPVSLAELSARQCQLLKSAAERVRTGGTLLYATCSTEPEENELVVDAFLESHPKFRLKRPESPKGIEAWLDGDGMFRSFPGGRLWDGFFAALMVRIS